MGWWDFAVRGFALLSTPRADVAGCDRGVEALARDSVAGRVIHAMSLAIRRAWTASRGRKVVQQLTAVIPSSEVAVWRLGGWIVAVVGATALAFDRLTNDSASPLISMTPALLVVAGAFVMACAAPLARAAADRRRRTSASPTQ
jgi:hypothetical protein